MHNEKDSIITYKGNDITLYSDERADYVSLTDIFKAWNRYSKSISAWLKTKQTLEFLDAWEKKNNPNYDPTQLSHVLKVARERNGLSVQYWIDMSRSKGIFTRTGDKPGTYAHKDIAVRFAGWLNPEFELFLVEEIQRLKKIEEQRNSYELLDRDQILYLIQLKEVFKYVAHQEAIEAAHKDVYASTSNAKNAFADFHVWRNKILDITPQKIDERIKQYCIDNNIPLSPTLMKKSKQAKLSLLDSYDLVKHAVWDFLQIKGEVNALNLATLVKDMIKTEKGEILLSNEDNIFQQKQDLGRFDNFIENVGLMKEVKSARQLLALKEAEKNKLSTHNESLKKALDYKPKDKE